MALIELQINMTRCAEALDRIAVVLERAFPVVDNVIPKKRGVESLARHSPEKVAEAQMRREIEKIRKEEGIDEVEK